MERSDQELVVLLQGGDTRALEELIARYNDRAFGMALRLTGSVEDAEEAMQDVWLSVYRKINFFAGKCTFSSWLYRVTVNSSLMKLRKRRQSKAHAFEDLNLEADTIVGDRSDLGDERLAHKQLCHTLEFVLHELPEDYRPVFVMRDIDGLSTQEVANVLGVTEPAVKARLHRARLIVRKMMAHFKKDTAAEKGRGVETEVC